MYGMCGQHMTLGDATAYALENPERLPNRRGKFRCPSCGRTFHQSHGGCPACAATVRKPMAV